MRTIMPAFDRHGAAGVAIGRIVVGYGELEFDFCRLIAAISGNFDASIKIMFRVRGESQRIQVADGLVRNLIPQGAFRTSYEETVAHLKHCLKIRNQYAHCGWTESMDRTSLGFIDLEKIANADIAAERAMLKVQLIKEQLARDQEQFCVSVMDWLNWLRLEWDCEVGRTSRPHYFEKPNKLDRPPLYSPRENPLLPTDVQQ